MPKFGKQMPSGATKSPRSYGVDDSSKPCSSDRVSYPDAWHNNEEAGEKAPTKDTNTNRGY